LIGNLLELEMVFYTQKMMSRKYVQLHHYQDSIVHESFILPSKEEGIMSRKKQKKKMRIP
jgi:hypothetical protein